MPRPPSFSLAICLRCQFRYSNPRPQLLPQRPLCHYKPTAAFFTTTGLLCQDARPAARQLIVLEPPGPWKPLNRPMKPPSLNDNNLVSGTNGLLTFEYKADDPLDATRMEISLYRPSLLKVSRERYQQMSQELDRAFLRAQLYDYYAEYLQHVPKKQARTKAVAVKRPSKREILQKILRNIWMVEVTDEIAEREDVLINREIKSCRRDIFFMVGEDGRILRDWAQEFSTRITVNVQTSAIQLRGSLANIERLESAMQDMLQKIVSEDVDLSWVSRRWTFNKEYITPIARLTNTFIEKIDDRTILVVALGPEKHAIDDVRRLLFTSLDIQFRSSYSLLYNALHEQEDPKGALYPFAEDSSLPWIFRGRDWARWRYIKNKSKLPLELAEKCSNTIKIRGERSLDGLEKIREILDGSANTETMEAETEQPPAEYHAILGCLLHDSEGSTMQNSPQTLEDFIKGEHPRVLSNEFPGVSFIAQAPVSRNDSPGAYKVDSPELIDSNITYSFSLRFVPSSWSNPKCFENYPPLKMTLTIDPVSGEVLSTKLVARHSESVADLLMPGRHCDLRFLRYVDVPLNLGISKEELNAGGVTHTEMARFMKESNLNPTGNDKLRSSPLIEVSIPPWMMQRFPGSRTTEVDYLFAGMEFKRDLSFDWNGLQLQHSVIEGGTSGGRRTEVKLIWKPPCKAQDKLEVKTNKEIIETHDAVEKELKAEAEERERITQEAEEAEEAEEAGALGAEIEVGEIETPAEELKVAVKTDREILETHAVEKGLRMGVEEREMITQVVETEEVEGAGVLAAEIEAGETETPAEEPNVAELEAPVEERVSEMQTFTEVPDSTFSSFVKNTMTLVRSLELRFAQSTKDGNGIQRK